MKPRIKPEYVTISAYASDDGEVSINLKQELEITVERLDLSQPTPIPLPSIGVDFNRDGPIDYDKTDKTSAAKPFNFWLNTDRDAFVADEKDQQDISPATGQDCADNRISVTRDLEDFSRLHIQAPAAFRPDGTWKCKLNFVKPTGSPAIRLYRADSPGVEYLTKPETATKQIAVASNLVVGSAPVEIPLSLFKAEGANKFRAALLFEAMKAGKGALQVHFYKNGKEQTAKNPVYLNLRPIADFYDYYQLPSVDLNGVTTNYNHPSATAKDIAASQTSDYILFVHGWRMLEWSKKAAAETAYKRLWQRGYKGKFGLFSWPTEYVLTDFWNMLGSETNRSNYNRSERKAWLSAAALRSLLTSLNASSPQKVRVLAHSMGNVVTSEALLLEAESQAPQKIVNTYIASQAATVAQAYDAGVSNITININQRLPNVYKSYPPTSQPYFDGTKGKGGIELVAGHLVNYFNRRDYALTFPIAWPGNQSTKPEINRLSDPSYKYESEDSPFRFYREDKSGKTTLNFPADRYEIFAHAAPAFSQALGSQVTAGPFSLNVDLGAAPFNFTSKSSDHSAQFNSDLMARYKYWDRLMEDSKIEVSPPK